jgi:hypothetical protein
MSGARQLIQTHNCFKATKTNSTDAFRQILPDCRPNTQLFSDAERGNRVNR